MQNKRCDVCNSFLIGNQRRYCSKKCKGIKEGRQRSKKPIIKQCRHCGNDFKPYTSLDKFCSANCRILNMKSKRSKNWKDVSKKLGKNNAAYVHGRKMRTAPKEGAHGLKLFFRNRDSYRQDLIEKHGYLFCENCGKTGCKFEAHHIIYRSEKPKHEHLHSKQNILNLCVKCHNWFHMWKGRRNAIVLERGLNVLFGDDVLDKKLPESEQGYSILRTTV